jgi:hypothetical protein
MVFLACGLAAAEEPTKGRIYIGEVKDAPAWVWEAPKASVDTNQIVVNAPWVSWVGSVRVQERADAQKAIQNAEAARADYLTDPRNRMLRPEAGGPQYARGRGVILEYNPDTLSGVISGDDGRRWLFRGVEWEDPRDNPRQNLWVDFVPEAETGYATFIYSLGPFVVQHVEFGVSK